MGALWHPFADMAAVMSAGRLTIDRGEGVYVWDTEGRRYLDAIAALWFCNVGYGRAEIADAVAAQMKILHAYHTFGDLSNRPAMELAERIAAIAPVPGSRVFFTSGGSDSVDTAAKLARRYWHRVGEPGRTVVISRHRSYHGMHGWGTSIAGIDPNREELGPMIGDVLTVPWDSADALGSAIESVGPHRVAGFFCEPVIGAGGVLPTGPDYLKQVQEICRETGVLFIADEVITGFGRAGDWFASNRFALEPDLIIFAKGVTSGYAPLGGVVIAPRVAEPFWSGDDPVMWRHGYTYSGHAAACTAGLANLDIMEREDIPGKALALESVLTEALDPLAAHPLVREVRSGMGVMAAIQFDEDLVAADPSLPGRALAAARRNGIMTRVVTGYAFQVSPPLIITAEQVGEMTAGFAAALDDVAGT